MTSAWSNSLGGESLTSSVVGTSVEMVEAPPGLFQPQLGTQTEPHTNIFHIGTGGELVHELANTNLRLAETRRKDSVASSSMNFFGGEARVSMESASSAQFVDAKLGLLQRQQSTQTEHHAGTFDIEAGKQLLDAILSENSKLEEAKQLAEERAHEITQKLVEATKALESMEMHLNCIFCLTYRRDRIFEPCGHIVACGMCIDGADRDKFAPGKPCPMCRVTITNTRACWLG